MPTYQYSCTECGHFFEQVQSFSDASLTECPACQGRLRKVFNAVGVVFKGSGFYRNDSRSEGSRSSGDTAAKSGDKAGSSESPSTSSSSSSGSSEKGGSSSAAASTAGSTTSGSKGSSSGSAA